MKIRPLAATAVFALALAGLVPASAASAADITVSGTVHFGSENVSDIQVGWYDPTTGNNEAVFSDNDGEFSFAVPSNVTKYYVVTNLNISDSGDDQYADNGHYLGTYRGANGTDYLYQTLAPYTQASGSLTFDDQLQAPGVIDGANVAFAGATVDLLRLDGSNVMSRSADDGGVFGFDHLIPGQYKLGIEGGQSKYLPWTSSTITVTQGNTQHVNPVATVGATIAGTVKAGSSAAKKATLWMTHGSDQYSTTTSSSGKYKFEGLPTGTYRLNVTTGWESGATNVITKTSSITGVTTGKTRTANIAVTKGAKISGSAKVTKGSNYFQVFAVNSKGVVAGSTFGQSKSKNPFTVTGLAKNKYTLYITDSKNTRYVKKSVTVKAGGAASAGTLKLSKKTITLKGKVSGTATGWVQAYSTGLPGNYGTISKGKYAIKGLIPGKYSVSVQSLTADVKLYKKVSIKKTTTKNLAAGKKFGKVTAKVLAGGVPVDGFGSLVSSGKYGDFAISNGSLTGYGAAGTAKINSTQFEEVLQDESPFYYALPTAKKTFTLKSGAVTSLGTVNIEIKGTLPKP